MRDRLKTAAPPSSPTRRQLITGVAVALGGLAGGSTNVWAQAKDEISHAAESIHQVTVINASRTRVYDALTDARQFNEITRIAAATDRAISLEKSPTVLSPNAGGTFSLFGGIILGRHVELVRNTRIVQAWRVIYWEAGVYSIVRFELVDQGAGTRIVFDHTGFPGGQAEHLAAGWKENYWEPLEKVLG
jgi:activator of HSP90 ATPase